MKLVCRICSEAETKALDTYHQCGKDRGAHTHIITSPGWKIQAEAADNILTIEATCPACNEIVKLMRKVHDAQGYDMALSSAVEHGRRFYLLAVRGEDVFRFPEKQQVVDFLKELFAKGGQI